MTHDEATFERECDAARARWEKLNGEEIAEVIDHCGDGLNVMGMMVRLAKKNYASDAHEILSALDNAVPAETAQELREYVRDNVPQHLPVLDKYSRLAAEELKIHDAWIEGEADAVLNFPDDDGDQAYDTARDEGRI